MLVYQMVMGLVLALGLALVCWLEMLKGKASETAHYLDLGKDSRLAQERSLQQLQQEQYKRELDQLVQE